MTEETKSMPSVGRIYGAIIAAKREVGAVGKNGSVTEYGKYDYRRFDDVLDAVAPLLNDHGILVTSSVIAREERQDGKKHFVTITMGFRLYAEDGSYIEASQVGEAFDVGDKAATKAQTVALRIFYCTTFNIPYNDMTDPEGGKQHAWESQDTGLVGRFTQRLNVVTTIEDLRVIFKECIKAAGTKEAPGPLRPRDVLSLKDLFEKAGRRVNCDDKGLHLMSQHLDAAASGVPATNPVIKGVEPVKYKDLDFDFSRAVDDAGREKCIMTLLQSYRSGSIDDEEMSILVTRWCPDNDSQGAACYLMGALYGCGAASEFSGLSGTVNEAVQTKQIGKDVGNALSQYAQHRIKKIGDDNDA